MTTASDTSTTTPAEPVAAPAVSTDLDDITTSDLAPSEPATETAVDEVVPAAEEDAAVEKWVHQDGWPHQWLEFHGDQLAIRIPNSAALTALYHAQSCSLEFQLELTGKVIASHISEESRHRVLSRMADPDDEALSSAEVWNDLLKQITELGAERAEKDAEALAAVKS